MSKIYANPFVWGEPVTGSNYLPRPDDQTQILSSLEKQSHLIISGYRGTGKSSLIRNILEKVETPSFYLDLRFIVSREDLIHLLMEGLETAFPAVKIKSRMESLQSSKRELGLSSIFTLWQELVKSSSKKFILVWDEFQHLIKLKDDLLDELRVALNVSNTVTHVFISHREDMLIEVFGNGSGSFFPNQTYFHLKNFESKACAKFLSQRFRRMGLSDVELPEAVLKFTEGQAQLTQKVAHSLAQIWLEGTTTRLLQRSIAKLLVEHNILFTAMWDEFGVNEKRLFIGLASGYSRPTELGFINKFGLSATSTAHNTVSKLLREGWLVNGEDGYSIYNPLFFNWLQNRKGLS